MRLRWSGELKKLAAFLCVFFCFGLLAGNLGIIVYRGMMRQSYKDFLATVMGNVMTNYPETDEEQLLKALQSGDNRKSGEEFLRRYGSLNGWDAPTFSDMEKRLFSLQVGVNLFGLFFFGSAGALFLVYFGRRQRKIEGLTDYMEALETGDYTLEVKDNADDELSGLRNEIYKLTVLLKEQAELASAQKKALADSVADISHQLKTPLTSVMVLMDNLSENVDMEESVRRKFMREITRQLSGMSWLVAAMLKLSRLEAGVVELKRRELRLEDLVDKALGKLEIEAEWREISFSVGLKESISVCVDESWTVEAFVNILKNALEHSPKGSVVELSGRENDIYAELTISDHGAGISEEERRRLFQRFYRGRDAREDSVGIGLALAREIVERQNGFISVDTKEGEGTTFSIRFMKLNF